MKIFNKNCFLLYVLFFTVQNIIGQSNVNKLGYKELFKKGVLSYKKGKWESARNYFLPSLLKCPSKDSLEIIKNEILNCDIADNMEKDAKKYYANGDERKGVLALEQLYKYASEDKIIKRRILSFWNDKRKSATRKKSYPFALELLNYTSKFDTVQFKKTKQGIENKIIKEKATTSRKILNYLSRKYSDTNLLEGKVADSLNKIDTYFRAKYAGDTTNARNRFIHFEVVGGVSYALPEFTLTNSVFNRIYYKPSSFYGIKLSLGRLNSKFSLSAEYRYSQYNFNTFFNSLDRKINLEDFDFSSVDIPIYMNYQLRPVRYNGDLIIISAGGVIHDMKSFYYQNSIEKNYSTINYANLFNKSSWYSAMIGVSFQKKIYKKLRVEVSIKYNRGLGNFLDLETTNKIFVPKSIDINQPINSLTSARLDSFNTSLGIFF